MTKFLEYLDHHTKDLFQSTKEVSDENLPIIYNSLATVKSFISLLGKIIKRILQGMPFTLSPKLEPNITTRVTGSQQYQKEKEIMQTLFVHMKLLANLFLLCIYQRKMCTKIYCVYTVQ